MKRTSRTPAIFAVFVVAASVWFGAIPAAAIDFLIPGVSLDSVSFTAGARVRYLVTSETQGTIDSSVVELAVLERRDTDARLEIYSAPVPLREEEAVTVRLSIALRVTGITSPDELRACMDDIEVRDGTGPFRIPDEEEIADFELERIFLPRGGDEVVRDLGTERIETDAGTFNCAGTELSRESRRAVKLGGIDAERVEREVSVIWLSPEVPFWGMVQSRVERRRETNLLADLPTVRLVPQLTVTASTLIAFEPGDSP